MVATPGPVNRRQAYGPGAILDAMREVVRRVLTLILTPGEAWDEIASEKTSIDQLIRRYIVPLALLAPAATIFGMKTFDASWDPAHGYLVPPEAIWAAGAATLFATIVSIFALAAIFVLIAPMYGSSREYVAALKVATYGAVPVLVAGATLVLPVMAMVAVVALCHTMFLYWLGVRRVLAVPAEAGTEFIGISLVMLGGASSIAGAALSSVGVF
jgi:hypothetical protein